MAFVSQRDPNDIAIAPRRDKWIIEDHMVASEIIFPGAVVEKFNDSGTIKLRLKSAEDDQTEMLVALNDPLNNKGLTDSYAIGSTVPVAWIGVGYVFWGFIPSAQDIDLCEHLEADDGGYVKAAGATTATANVARFKSLTDTGAVVAKTGLRVQRIC